MSSTHTKNSNNIDTEIASFYKGKKILLIGGTGSVGSGMIDMLLKYDPKVIRIFSRDEYKQYVLSNKYGRDDRRLRYLLGDVRDYERVEKASSEIDIIFNLAALKHVPACEYNPFEAVKTNVIGTQNVINAAISCDVRNVVFTSSDKAISPTNAMGATKLLGERLMIAADNMKGGANISFSAVRFGNVMGSRGSVVPLFVDQIRRHNQVNITEPLMTRFMMSVTDAIALTLKAATIARGGEIFVLKMPNVSLTDLVECVVELTCEKYGIDKRTVKIKEIGIRPGEKMSEELMTDYEVENAYELSSMYVVVPQNYKHNKVYDNVPKMELDNYSSKNVPVISKKEVKELLIREQLV